MIRIVTLSAVTLLFAVGCGLQGKSEEPQSEKSPAGQESSGEGEAPAPKGTIDCNGEKCEASSQYCLLSKILGNDRFVLTSECRVFFPTDAAPKIASKQRPRKNLNQ